MNLKINDLCVGKTTADRKSAHKRNRKNKLGCLSALMIGSLLVQWAQACGIDVFYSLGPVDYVDPSELAT